jgi:thiol-disulfide isomerase/thioredoxin
VMGFVVLAAMLKYLASADQAMQLNFLTRERFLAVWIVLFAMAGLYLLGFLRLEGITKDEPLGIPRLLIGMTFLIVAISLIPGMFGSRLGDLEAYVPPAAGSSAFSSAGGESLAWMKNQFREALEKARREGKLVFVNFTGYACANCHWMKANMFTRPEIGSVMKDFVLVDLYTDGTDEASRQNQELLEKTFATIAIPYYAIFTPDGKVVASFPGLTRNPQEFLAFLNQPAETKSGALMALDAPSGAGVALGVPSGAGVAPAALPLKSLDGGAFDTASLTGKVVVLNFWATWCVPCIQEIPGFNKINEQLANKGVKVVGVSMDEDGAAVVKPFLKDHPMNYTVALGSEKLSQQFQVSEKLPITVVLDRSGKAIQRFEGFTHPEAIEAAVKQAL